MECHQQQALEPAGLECNYRVGDSLHFAIMGLGLPDGLCLRLPGERRGWLFRGSRFRYEVRRRPPGYEREDTLDFAFVSTRSGIVYRSVAECTSAP